MSLIFSFKNRNQNITGLRDIIEYCQRPHKINNDKKRLSFTTGINCTEVATAEEFMLTKRMHKKDGGHMFYHYCLSYGPEEQRDPLYLHKASIEYAKMTWPGYEVLVSTHTETDHTHSHFVVNSVNLETGRKYDVWNRFDVLKDNSREISRKYGLTVVEERPDLIKRVSLHEKHAKDGTLFKQRLRKAIDTSMAIATNKEDFIDLMKKQDIKADFNDKYKVILYTLDDDFRCSSRKLGNAKYDKEMMLREFETRRELLRNREEHKRTTTEDSWEPTRGIQSASVRPSNRYETSGDESTQSNRRSDNVINKDDVTTTKSNNGNKPKATQGRDRENRNIRSDSLTGWEKQRETFIEFILPNIDGDKRRTTESPKREPIYRVDQKRDRENKKKSDNNHVNNVNVKPSISNSEHMHTNTEVKNEKQTIELE